MRTKTRRRVRIRKEPTRRKTRVTVDFPRGEHRKLKAMAALEGVTLQAYIRARVKTNFEKKVISKNKFKFLKKKIIQEHEDILERLANE